MTIKKRLDGLYQAIMHTNGVYSYAVGTTFINAIEALLS